MQQQLACMADSHLYTTTSMTSSHLQQSNCGTGQQQMQTKKKKKKKKQHMQATKLAT
jgi:hypothetical protein